MSKYAYVIEQSSGSEFETVGVATSIENAKKIVKEQELKESATTVYKIPFDSYGYHDKECIDRLIWSHEMNKDDEGPALPGMSLRDWLAGMAMQGMMANRSSGFDGVYVDENGILQPQQTIIGALTNGAKVAYMMADIMIKETENDSTS